MAQYIKDKKISILKSVYVRDEYLQEIEQTVLYAEGIWAYYRQASAKETFEAGQAGYKVDAIFRINWRDDLKSSMTIVFRGDEYNIKRIDDFEGYKNDLTIYAEARI